jgi:hypothetical protein
LSGARSGGGTRFAKKASVDAMLRRASS